MGKIIGQIGKTVGKFLGVQTNAPDLPPVPPAPPIVPRQAVQPNDAVREETKRKIAARRGRSGTIKTGARGVTTGEKVTYQSLLGGGSSE